MQILGIVSASSKEVPNAPTIGTATDVGTARAYNNGAATVTFTAPTFDGGLPITSYTATSSPGGFTASGAASPLTVTGLQSGVAYTFTVTATNAAGTSAASAASNSITATTVPQAPTIGTATAGDAQATVTFSAGATGGKTVSTYTATSSPSSITGTAASSPITVTGLVNGTAYTFTVTATNANGTSTASAASNSVTPAVQSSYESIASFTTTASQTTVTFSSIPQTYEHLQIRYTGALTNSSGICYLRFNGDSTANYHFVYSASYGTTPTLSGGAGSVIGGVLMQGYNGTPTNANCSGIVEIQGYTASKQQTAYSRESLGSSWNTLGCYIDGAHTWGTYNNINSITLVASVGAFTTGSVFALYGIKAS